MLKHKISAFSLVELLVSLVIASLLLSSLIAAYVASSQQYQNSVNNDRLNQSLQTALNFMASDIRRAGYWKNASSDLSAGSNHNPFMTNDININTAQNCILLTYDRLGLGSLPTIGTGSDDERYGFRLMNNAIQTRPNGAAYDCTASANSWSNITDPNVINITQLTFTKNTSTISVPASSGSPTVTRRSITISITGQLVTNSAISKTLTQVVRVRNDLYAP